jgi:hypothetical protein
MSTPAAPATRRPVLLAIGVGVAVALVAIAIAFSIFAMPFFALARFAEPGSGLDRPLVRTGLFRVAIPVGLVLGTLTGVAVARWYRRGGHLPREWD